ncbi:MAG: DNA translocase FtsK 4TM domain-containing protein, partial [Verrucomicrobia bacterium]|nr:DNA translocase FtsK 4TM domain-containing protein [Verrucomicrobiota bacterium]
MASANNIPDMGRRVLWGFFLTALCLFLALSLFSYDGHDIGWLQAPPNDPPVNLFGPVGAWVSFVLFMAMGLGAYLVPWICLVLGIILIVNRQQRVWPRMLWGLALLVAVVAVVQLDGQRWGGVCQALNIWPDAGGLLGRLFMKETLERWLSPVGAGILTATLLLLSLVMTIDPRNVWRGCLGAAGLWRTAGEKVTEAVASRQDRREQIEREGRRLEKERRRLERVVGDAKPALAASAPVRTRGA